MGPKIITEKVFGIEKPDIDESKFENTSYNDLRPRLLAIIDSQLKNKGIDAFIPRENRPYEMLSDQERADFRSNSGGSRQVRPRLRADAEYNAPEPESPVQEPYEQAPKPKKETASQRLRPKYGDAALLAALDARQSGYTPASLALVPPKALAEQNEEAQKAQLDDVLSYVRRGRNPTSFLKA